MIPILYEKTETSFSSNGLGRLRDCITCVVTEERNGIYECDFEYPVSAEDFDDIQIGRIIGVTHDESDDVQPFDIVSYSKPIDGIVTFHCTHISYRQSYMTVTGTGISTLADAFTLLGTAEPSNPFIYSTDKDSTGYLGAANGVPHSVRQMLGGIEGSILDTYGGEFEWDKWDVKLWAARGQTRDFAIRYGVNMVDYNEECSSEGTYSSCVPYWTNGEVTVVGGRVDSYGATATGRGECVPLDLSSKWETPPTVAQLESAALAYMGANNTFLPVQNIHVEFIRLQDTKEYLNLSKLLECNLCDTIQVIFPDYNTSGSFKIVKTVWDVLMDRYESMELGDRSMTLADALGVTQGPEGQSTNQYAYYDISGKITPETGVTISTAYAYIWGGRVAQIYVVASFDSAQTANNSYNIGTLDSSLQPHALGGITSTYGAGQITTGGVMSFRPQMNLNANSNRYFTAVYMLKTKYKG